MMIPNRKADAERGKRCQSGKFIQFFGKLVERFVH